MAVSIYKCYNDNTYKFNLEVFNRVLEKIGDRPVAIYSVCETLRKGKSFVLSVFLRYMLSEGKREWIKGSLHDFFKHRSGLLGNLRPAKVTTRVSCWPEPIILRRSDGTEIALLLLGSQGFFDQDTPMKKNGILFSLMTLLSSHVIINIENEIEESLLQFIQYFGSWARRVGCEESQDEPFQNLLFLVLRDYEYQNGCSYKFGYYDDEVSINGQNFKKDYLDPTNASEKETKFVREQLHSSYGKIGTYLLPHPGRDLAERTFDLSTFDQKFKKHLIKLTESHLKTDSLILKQIGGQIITGNMLKELAKRWTEIFENQMTESKSVFEATAEVQHQMAKNAGFTYYKVKFTDELESDRMKQGVSDDILKETHSKLEKEAIDIFDSYKKIGSKQYTASYIEKLQQEISSLFEGINANNLKKIIQKLKTEKEEALKAQQKAESERNQAESARRQAESERNQAESARLRVEADPFQLQRSALSNLFNK